ncbi:FAD-dependent monooxygenase [Nocardiopsis sp. NPDC058631]|uniref:FAD-dependent monooxygenase n=1 Tax=Nocardiopsis sp. NPDC058631 TaxID=3346566 RepID=UPI00365827DE
MPISNRNMLIAGGGAAGPVLAHWLARHGFAPTVVEQAPDPAAGGYLVEVSPQGMGVLDRMGVGERVRAAGGPLPDVHSHISGRERPIVLPQGHVGAVAIRSGDLSSILRDRADDGVEYLLGDSVTSVDEDADGVDVAFAHAPPRRFDLVVGADGPDSAVRGLVFGADAEGHAEHLDANLATFEVDNFLGVSDVMMCHVWPYRGCVVTTFPGNDRLEVELLMRNRTPAAPAEMDLEARYRFLEEVYGEDGWEVPGLLRAMRGADVRLAPSTQIRMDVWSRGRTVLVGDAAHAADPMAGQGTALALMGATALAGELVFAEGDHERAFFSYEAAMRGTVRAAQSLGPVFTRDFAPEGSRGEVWLRERTDAALLFGSRLMAQYGARSAYEYVGNDFPADRYARILAP